MNGDGEIIDDVKVNVCVSEGQETLTGESKPS